MKKMKKGMATKDDGMAVEMLAALGDYGTDIQIEIIWDIHVSREVASQMCKSTFITIPKIPGTLKCNKH